MKGRAIKASRTKKPENPTKVPSKKERHAETHHHDDGTRGDVEIHRSGPGGEVNILRLDSNGDTMLLEKGDMMRMYDDEGIASAEILRLDTAVVGGSPEPKTTVPTLGPLAVEGKWIVASSATCQKEADIMRIHTSEEGNMLWMQGACGGTPMMYPASPGDFTDGVESRGATSESAGASAATALVAGEAQVLDMRDSPQ